MYKAAGLDGLGLDEGSFTSWASLVAREKGKASACNAGDLGPTPGSGRSPGAGNGNPLQCSCLENPMDGGAWWAIVHGVEKSRTQLSNFTSLHAGSQREEFHP